MTSCFFAFDIDGVIVDSELVHFRALQEVVGKEGLLSSPDELIGLSLEETLLHCGIKKEKLDFFIQKIEETYVKLINTTHIRPDVTCVIDMLHSQGHSYGFVSSASRKVCEANLNLLNITSHYHLVSRDDVQLTKPNAEPYLKLCSLAGFTPTNTIAIEDSDIGISAAHAAGIKRIYAWPHQLSGGQRYEFAYKKIKKLDEIEEMSFIKEMKLSNDR